MDMETQRTILRPFYKSDLADLYAYSSQSGVGELAGWKPHTVLEESQRVLTENMQTPDMFAIESKEDGRVIGHIRVHDDSENGREDTKELGCVLNRDYQRRGLMTEVVLEVLSFLRAKGIKHVYACCFQENIPSRGLIEKCGFIFEREGTFYAKTLEKTFQSFEYVCHM